VDGNKRAAFLAIGMFLAINGKRLQVPQVEAIQTILALKRTREWQRVKQNAGKSEKYGNGGRNPSKCTDRSMIADY
jgi:prophage maintenance system killer protein